MKLRIQVKLRTQLIALVIFPISAQSALPQLQVNGLQRTDISVIQTELSLRESWTPDEFQQQLLSTGLFLQVAISAEAEKWSVDVQEKWTTIPIFKLSSGGGVTQSVFGVYDPNVAGKRLELGAQYEILGPAESTVFWFKDPRLNESRYFIDLQSWNTKRVRLKYDQTIRDPLLTKALLQRSRKNYMALGHEFLDGWRAQFSLEHQEDSFSTDLVPQKFLDEVPSQTIPSSSKVRLSGFQFEYTDEKLNGYFSLGSHLKIQLKHGSPEERSLRDFSNLSFLYTHHHPLGNRLLYSQRITLGYTDTEILQFWNYLGGLESIRGYRDNRFATRSYWLSNSELRFLTHQKSNYLLQAVSFVDLVGIDESTNSIENLHAGSYGAGLRVIVPKVYRLTLRLDLAQTFIRFFRVSCALDRV